MKASLNVQFMDGPYGGGMQFANFMCEFMQRQGITVVNHLRDDDIDVILHINPFPFLTPTISAYSFFDAHAYKLLHPNTCIIERVNECDERKGTHYLNTLLMKVIRKSDMTVYIASWLKTLLESQGLPKDIPSQVILNGADALIFNTEEKKWWDGTEPLKIVTHHWSNNPNKGHDVYQALDTLLDNAEFAEKFSFTYIGRVPKGSVYRNTAIKSPLSGRALAEELKSYHVYITASRNEPAGMHHIEAALCGLPLLYIDSGALPEYCNGFGILFSKDNVAQKLLEMRRDYGLYRDALQAYPNTAEHMGAQYLALMKELQTHHPVHTPTTLTTIKAFGIRLYGALFEIGWKLKHKLQLR